MVAIAVHTRTIHFGPRRSDAARRHALAPAARRHFATRTEVEVVPVRR